MRGSLSFEISGSVWPGLILQDRMSRKTVRMAIMLEKVAVVCITADACRDHPNFAHTISIMILVSRMQSRSQILLEETLNEISQQ